MAQPSILGARSALQGNPMNQHIWRYAMTLCERAANYCAARSGMKHEPGKRICSNCRKQIKRHDHWRFAARGPQHWNCEYPQKVLPAYLHKHVTEQERDDVHGFV